MFYEIGHIALRVKDYAAQRVFLEGRLGLSHAFSLSDAEGSERIGYYRLPDGRFIELFPKRALRDHGFSGANEADARSYQMAWLGSAAATGPTGRHVRVVDAENNAWALDEDAGSSAAGAGDMAPAGAGGAAGLFGVTFTCAHFDETVAFYRDALGCAVQATPAGALCLLPSGQWIELVDKPYHGVNKTRDKAFSHVALLTRDIAAVSSALEARGIGLSHGSSLANPYFDRPYAELMKPGSDGSYAFYFMDPEGNDIEAMQYTEQSLQLVGGGAA